MSHSLASSPMLQGMSDTTIQRDRNKYFNHIKHSTGSPPELLQNLQQDKSAQCEELDPAFAINSKIRERLAPLDLFESDATPLDLSASSVEKCGENSGTIKRKPVKENASKKRSLFADVRSLSESTVRDTGYIQHSPLPVLSKSLPDRKHFVSSFRPMEIEGIFCTVVILFFEYSGFLYFLNFVLQDNCRCVPNFYLISS